MKVVVSFEYDETSTKWEVSVKGAHSEIDARDAFSSVVLTCLDLNPDLLKHTQVELQANIKSVTLNSRGLRGRTEPVYSITPAVRHG